jgi:hypothetical protein
MPFRYIKTTSTAVATKSVLFNGSNQYLSVGSVANWAFLNNGLTPFTIEAWVNPTSVSTAVQPNIVATTGYQAQIGFYFVIGNYNNGDLTFAICDGRSKINQWSTSNNFLTANTWTHVAVSFTPNGTNVPSATVKFFVSGVLATSSNVYSRTTTYSTSNPTNTLLVGALQTPLANYFPGYISNLRILNGTALYTSSFTVPTSPLTAIANTSLLTCNADTIVDSSTNNFTITNNNTATVSSVVPFNAVGYGYKFKNVSNPTSGLAGTQKAIFGYGSTGTVTAITNLVSNTGVVANDTAGVGTARYALAAAGYGTDKVLFGYGTNLATSFSMTNKVSNIGVVSEDTTGVGTSRSWLAAAGYGTDKAIFGYGTTTANGSSTGRISMTNLVSNAGVVSTDTTGVGTTRCYLAAAGYGTDKAIFGYGYGTTPTYVSMTNLVSNTGVVATDTTGVGTARSYLAAAGYGSDKAIFGYGYTPSNVSMTNLVSNTGVVASDTTGVGTARAYLTAAGYGTDKAIFGYGHTTVNVSMTNLVSNTGVVSTDTTGVGTARYGLAAAGFSANTDLAQGGLKFKKVFADPVTSIVTSGLVLNLDAGNIRSYAGSGTSWFNLSGNNTGSLTNGPTYTSSFGGGIVFDGVNDYVNIPYSSSLSPATQFTLGAFVNITGWGSNFASIIYKQNNFTSLYEQYSFYIDSGSFSVIITGTDRVQRGVGGSYTFGETAYLCVTANSTTGVAEAYKNGVKVNTTTGITAFDISTKPVTIGAATPTNYPAYAKGRIHIAQIYNRSLSASEILQNYNALRSRFGL